MIAYRQTVSDDFSKVPEVGALGPEKYGCVRSDPQTPYPLPFALLPFIMDLVFSVIVT